MKSSIIFFGVQPIKYSFNIRNELLVRFASYNFSQKEEMPEWITYLNKYYPYYQYRGIKISESDGLQLLGCEFIFKCFLIASSGLNTFLLTFEFQSKNPTSTTINTDDIRNIFVSGTPDKREQQIKDAIDKSKNLISEILSINREDLEIQDDTCNLTAFIIPGNAETGSITMELCRNFIGDDKSERNTAERELISISKKTLILFGGRVHVVCSLSEDDVMVIKNIILNLQFVWFFVPLYIDIASILHNDIITKSDCYSVDDIENKSQVLSYISHTIKLKNESAKISYEKFTRMFYDVVEKSWGIERSIDQLNNYVSFFDIFVKEISEKRRRKADELLNNLLAILAFFGFVGFWADILHAEMITKEWKTFHSFGSFIFSGSFPVITLLFVVFGIVMPVLLIRYSMKIKHGKKIVRKKSFMDKK